MLAGVILPTGSSAVPAGGLGGAHYLSIAMRHDDQLPTRIPHVLHLRPSEHGAGPNQAFRGQASPQQLDAAQRLRRIERHLDDPHAAG